jgi:hypothetical protein
MAVNKVDIAAWTIGVGLIVTSVACSSRPVEFTQPPVVTTPPTPAVPLTGAGTVTLNNCENVQKIVLMDKQGAVAGTGTLLIVPPFLCQFKFTLGE